MRDWFYYKDALRPNAERIADLDAAIDSINKEARLASRFCLDFERAKKIKAQPHLADLKSMRAQIAGA